MTAPKKMGWLEYIFGVASRKAKGTWSEMKDEYRAGLEGKPSPAEQRRPATPPTPRRTGPPWWEVLRVPKTASLREVALAYRDLVQKNHPDKVAHMSESIRRVADEETRRLNTAYADAQRMLGGDRTSR